jgi:hypothetical protein
MRSMGAQSRDPEYSLIGALRPWVPDIRSREFRDDRSGRLLDLGCGLVDERLEAGRVLDGEVG